MLTASVVAAMRHARYEWLDESRAFYGEIPELPGVWATADDQDQCAEEPREVLEGWIALGLSLKQALPTIDGVTDRVTYRAPAAAPEPGRGQRGTRD